MERNDSTLRSLIRGILLWFVPLAILFALINGVANGNIFDPNQLIVRIKPLLQPAHTIFLAILIESLPFILVGAIVSSLIHTYIREDQIARWMPRKRFASVVVGSLIGFVIPVCDCGTIPIARSMLQKGIPRSAVISFVLSAPVVNPVTLIATYFAFGLNLKITLIRFVCTFVIACMVGFLVGEKKETITVSRFHWQSRMESSAAAEHPRKMNRPKNRFRSVMDHTVEELFGIVGFLICSAAVASLYQVYHTQHSSILHAQKGMLAVVTLMGLAILFSLCSTADAFVARSFATQYAPGAVIAFMIIGQMADLRNLFLLPKTFGVQTAMKAIVLCLIFSFIGGMIL
jgi:uncharacterized protein